MSQHEKITLDPISYKILDKGSRVSIGYKGLINNFDVSRRLIDVILIDRRHNVLYMKEVNTPYIVPSTFINNSNTLPVTKRPQCIIYTSETRTRLISIRSVVVFT